MSLIEIECRVSWVNAALRYFGRELEVLHDVYAGWSQHHGRLCNAAYGRPFVNA